MDSLIQTNVMMESEVKHATVSTASSPEEGKDGTLMVKLSKVEPNREQPRKNFDEDSLQELAESLKQFGMLQPILVQNRGDYYEIIAGERTTALAACGNTAETAESTAETAESTEAASSEAADAATDETAADAEYAYLADFSFSSLTSFLLLH